MSRRIVFYAQTGDCANPIKHESDPEEFDTDVTDEELQEMAQEFMWENLQPEFWWEVVDDDEGESK